ncbi:MAG: CCA tRNA nucleotidyltransferase [Candidatus Micrarchaeota archaeon]
MLSRVLAKIKPSPHELEREINFCNILLFRIKAHVPRKCEVVLTGSMAKKTFLHDKKDVDIFVLFPKSASKSSFEPTLKKIMLSCFPNIHYQFSYAEHPYARFKYEGRSIDLVPAYKISDASERLSAVDRSVLHTEFVKSHLKKTNIDDVLLLKKFLHANSLYGAEIKIKGFSGYLCELLIIKYGNFQKLLKAVSKWKEHILIDLKKYYKKNEFNHVFEKFGDFVIIDPTDKNRNVAAAVSKENLRLFMKTCQKFLKKPSESFFFKQIPTFEQKIISSSKNKKTYLISMPRPDIVDDVLWGQIYKMIHQLTNHLEEYDPKIIADDHKHLVRLAVIVADDKMPVKMLVEGPPIEMEDHLMKFKLSHRKAKFIIKNKKIYAQVKRPVIRLRDAIHDFFKEFRNSPSHLACSEELVIIELFNPYKSKK